MKNAVWGFVTLLVAACTDATTISGGVCGNYVLEPEHGEDCDRPGESCTDDCRIACSPTSATVCAAGVPDGACCPADAVCGADERCHVATGLFAPADRTTTFTAGDFAVGRVDGDLIDDVLGASSGSVEARFGHGTAPLDRAVTRRAPFATGSFAIGDTTGDGRLDVLFPTGAGIYGFETAGPEPEAIVFPARIHTGIRHARIATLTGPQLARVDWDHSAARFVMAWEPGAQRIPVCNGMSVGPNHKLYGRGIHVTGSQVAFVLGVPGVQGFALCLERPGASTRIDVMRRPTEGEVFYANVSGGTASCPELLVPVLGIQNNAEGTLIFPGIGTAPACGLGQPFELTTTNGPVGSPLAAIQAGARSALVTSGGIYDVATSTRIVESTRSWRYAAVGDFNNDGRHDFATAGFQEDVEVIEQRATPGEWNAVRIPTVTMPAQLATGDFDGDGHDDLAIATLGGEGGRTAQISVTYGGPTLAFDAPIVAGTIEDFSQLIVAPLVDPSLPDGFDHSDDLVIAHGGGVPSSRAKLTYMFGSASRNVTSPWLFESKFGGQNQLAGEGWAVAIGRFGANRSAGAIGAFTISRSVPMFEPIPDQEPIPHTELQIEHDDIPEAEAQVPRETTNPAFAALGWNANDATFDSGPQDVVDCTGSTTLCPTAGARFTATSLPEGELLLALSGQLFGPGGTALTGCGHYHLDTGGAQAPQLKQIACSEPNMSDKLNGVSTARAIAPIADVEHGVLVTQTVKTGARDYGARIWSIAVANSMAVLSEAIDLEAEVRDALGSAAGVVACMDAEVGELAGTDDGYGVGPDLVVACSVGSTTRLLVRYAAPERGKPPRYRELLDAGDVTVRIKTGDVNGDGLDDLVYTTGATELHVRLQCDSHAEGCR